MRIIIIRILTSALGLLIASHLVPGIDVGTLYAAIIAALVLGIINLCVRPVLVLFTLPLTIFTLGLFLFVINALLFRFVASFIEGFEVAGFGAALLGSLIVSIVHLIGNHIIR